MANQQNNPDNVQSGGKRRKPNPQGKQGKQGKGGKPPAGKGVFGTGNKDDRRGEEIADTAYKVFKSKRNDVSWYKKFSDFADDASRISFATPLGTTLPVDFNYVTGSAPYSFKYGAAGVMRIVFSPSVGISKDFTSPLNRSSINFYGRLRSVQKAFGEYDHQDATIMMLAIDSLIMFHSLARRIYGLLTDMTPVNKYYPRILIGASGVSFPDTQKTISDFRSWINEFGLQIEQYALPDNIALFNRHTWMCEGIYVDSVGKKAQTYMFVPRGFWKYNGTASTGGQLEFVEYIKPGDTTTTQYTIAEFEALGESLLNALSNDADFAQLSGDLLAYYGDKRFHLPFVDEKYSVEPVYNETVMSQIENATLMGDWATGYNPTIYQDPSVNKGALIFQPAVMTKHNWYSHSIRMNMHVDRPSEDQVLEATRLVTTYGAMYGDGAGRYIAQCATEICHFVDIFAINPATNGFRSRRVDQSLQLWALGGSEALTPAQIRNLLGDVIYMASFDWAPRLEILEDTNFPDSALEYIGCTWDLDNLTNLADWQLENIHAAALYSLFNIAT